MAHEFQAAASKLGKSLATMKDAALRTSSVIEHVANRTVQLLGARTKEIIANPAPYAGELLLCATMPQVAFARLLYIKNTNQLSKHAKEFARLLREEGRIVHAAAAGGIDVPIQTPLLKALGNAAAEVKQNGSAGKGYSSLCEEVYATCKELPTDKDFWEDIFKGNVDKKGYPSGFHTEHNYPNRLIPLSRLLNNESGIYAGIYHVKGKEKLSTFFPKQFNIIEIRNFIEEVFKNPIKKMNFCVIGNTSQGMKIKIVFKKIEPEKLLQLQHFLSINA